MRSSTNYYQGDKSKEDDMGGACKSHGRDENKYKILVAKSERKRSPGRLKRTWDDKFKIDLRETACDGVDWIHLAPDRDQWRTLANTTLNPRITYKAGNFFTR
jgi:hypothetical protein